MNKKILIFGLVLLVVGVATASTLLFLFPYKPTQPPTAVEVNWTPQGVKDVVKANNKFAFDLYHELSKKEDGNIFFSPYSISAAFAMVYEGAMGKTAKEIQDVFYFPEKNVLRANFARIYNKINEYNKDYTMRTGNALWVQQNYPILEDYLDRVEKYYGGKAANLDFMREAEKSRQTINSFIEEQTNEKIKNLLPPGSVNTLTRLIITNAVYFKGDWKWEFDPKDTEERDFHVDSEHVVKVPMMYMKPDKAKFRYANLEKLQILELPYKGDRISMLILLPKQGQTYNPTTGEVIECNYTIKDIEDELTIDNLKKWESEMEETKLGYIYLPKFELKERYTDNLKGILIDLGMPSAFKPQAADFSGITGKKDLFISFVTHQAYVKVDEKGTEAAAATAVGVAITAVEHKIIFKADHPFIFIIQDKETGNILFLGRIINPAE